MARHREFEEADALRGAVDAFWDLGYDAVNTSTLERRMGISRSSLYATFGSKDELYVRALDRYVEDLRQRVQRELEAGGPALQVLRSFFYRAARRGAPGAEPLRCCMVVRACVTGGDRVPAVRTRLERAVKELDALFLDLLKRAREEGTIRSEEPLGGLARFLTTTYQALNIAAHAGRSRRQLHEIVRTALAAV